MTTKSLKDLRESSGLTQTEISKRTGISTTRLSLAENHLGSLTHQEEESVRKSIVELTNERSEEVLKNADPRFRRALHIIEANRGHKKLFETLTEQGYSAAQAAVFVLGCDYPSGAQLFIKE
jgi:transcriptional regulator with XRE-family HTH domain